MSVSHWSGAEGLERYASLKYYIVEKWKRTFTLGLSDAKNTQYTKKKTLNKSCSKLNFEQKSQWTDMSVSTRSEGRELFYFGT